METLKQLAESVAHKKRTSQSLVYESMERVKKHEKKMHAFMRVTEKEAMEKAKKVDLAIQNNEAVSALAGIPYVAKDNYSVKDIGMSASSKMLDDYISPYNATVIARLQDAVCIGKTNLDSFAFGSSTENSGYGPTHNPWDISKVPGGSSGGSAAAVASGMALFGLGTDTGGSVRQPASLCGIVGLKPTYGRISRYGLAAMGSSLDCPGIFTRSVEDAAFVLGEVAGVDEKDATSVDVPVEDYTQFKSVKGLKAGLAKEFFDEKYVSGLDAGVKEKVLETVKLLEKMGVEIVEVSIPHSVYALPVYYVITPSEISANMARYDGIRYGHTTTEPKDLLDLYFISRESFEDEVKRRIFVGNYTLASGYYDAYYNKAMQVRTIIIDELRDIFTKVDFLVCPTSPTVAFGIGEKADDPVAMYLSDIYTVTANIAGIPGISIPCGLSENLPVGFQIMGNQFAEKTILDVAYALEKEIDFTNKYQHILAGALK
jgi:aspartyl-tRNA(Asn)/glutamyl-tRNA(Gln) amidotransferase subunit A